MVKNIKNEIAKLAENFEIDHKRSIGDVARDLNVKTHVIRFWEENFPQIKPHIGAGGRRYYYNKQLHILRRIKKFLYEEGYTISGLKKLLSKKKNSTNYQEDINKILDGEEENIVAETIDSSLTSNYNKNKSCFVESDFKKEEPIPNVIKIGKQSLLSDFANIEVPLIDPRIKISITDKVNSIKLKLEKLKSIIKP